MQSPPAPPFPPSPQISGRGRHLPCTSGWVQLAPWPPWPPSPPSAGSQYQSSGQSAELVQSSPGVTHSSNRHTSPFEQQTSPHTRSADAQHEPFRHTPPMQSPSSLHSAAIPPNPSPPLPPAPP